MLGYPVFGRDGLTVQAIYQPAFSCGVPIEIKDSIVPHVNGRWFPARDDDPARQQFAGRQVGHHDDVQSGVGINGRFLHNSNLTTATEYALLAVRRHLADVPASRLRRSSASWRARTTAACRPSAPWTFSRSST
jgi:hypothetical protein